MLINNGSKFPDTIVVRSIKSPIEIRLKVIKNAAFFAPKHADIQVNMSQKNLQTIR